MDAYVKKIAEDARFVILRELRGQTDSRLNEMSFRRLLDVYGIKRSREWLETQLIQMAELGVITTAKVETVLVATLTSLGRDHMDERAVVAGITCPSEFW